MDADLADAVLVGLLAGASGFFFRVAWRLLCDRRRRRGWWDGK